MFEVGGIEDSRRQHNDGRVVRRSRRQRRQRVVELRRVIIHGQDVIVLEQFREDALHDLPVLHHVRHSRRNAQIVLQHVDRAIAVPDEIRSADMCPHAQRRIDAAALGPEIPGVRQHLGRKHAVLHDFLIVVQVIDEQVERLHALLETGAHPFPLAARDDARNQVQRPRPVNGTVSLGIHREGDSHFLDGQLQGRLPGGDVLVRHRFQVGGQLDRAIANSAARTTQLVVHAAYGILLPVDGHRSFTTSISVTSTPTCSRMLPPPNTTPLSGGTSL